jgi:hypothetical protein
LLSGYGKNNLAAHPIATIVVALLVAPFIERAQLRRDSVLEITWCYGAYAGAIMSPASSVNELCRLDDCVLRAR